MRYAPDIRDVRGVLFSVILQSATTVSHALHRSLVRVQRARMNKSFRALPVLPVTESAISQTVGGRRGSTVVRAARSIAPLAESHDSGQQRPVISAGAALVA